MKTAFLGLLLTILLFSCSKNNNFYPALGTLTVDIDGVPTTFTNCKANISTGKDSSSSLSIEAETADSISTFDILFQNYQAPIQHPLIHTLTNGKFNLPNVW